MELEVSFPLPDCHTCHIPTHTRSVLESQNLPHQSQVLWAGGGSVLPCFSLSHLLCLFPSTTFSPQSPRAETLMKTNARNQFEASSFHLAGARLCTSISTPAGGELLQQPYYTHQHLEEQLWATGTAHRRMLQNGRNVLLKA